MGSRPTLPFWFGEAPQRTGRFESYVADVCGKKFDRARPNVLPGYVSQAIAEVAEAAALLKEECGV